MSFIPHKGKFHIEYWAKKASTAFTKDCLVQKTSGAETVEPCTSSSTDILGINIKTIASTDSDYASKTLIPIVVPDSPASEIEGDVTNTLLSTDPGTKFDLSDSLLVDQDATTNKVLLCKKFISASKGIFSLCGYSGFNK